MPRFFVSPEQIIDQKIFLSGEDAHHIARSLRMAKGEHITVSDGSYFVYNCILDEFVDDKTVVAIINEKKEAENEPPFLVTLYQAVAKGDKMDSIIQKSVECGVSKIVPFESRFCVVKIQEDGEGKKQSRRQKIAMEAAKQAGRDHIPEVSLGLSFEQMIDRASKADIPIFCYEGYNTVSLKKILENKKELFTDISHKPTISVVIGSEGGFSEEEAQRAEKAGFSMANLGKRILRTETASSFVLSCLVYALEL